MKKYRSFHCQNFFFWCFSSAYILYSEIFIYIDKIIVLKWKYGDIVSILNYNGPIRITFHGYWNLQKAIYSFYCVRHMQRCLFWNLLIQTKIRLYSSFPDWFRFGLTRFRRKKYLCLWKFFIGRPKASIKTSQMNQTHIFQT